MLIQNTTITLRWIIEKNPNFATYNEDYFDLQVTAPDGTVTYLEGINNWANVFTQVSEEVNGEIDYNITLTQTGIYTFILCTGDSDNFDIIKTSLAMVVEQDSWLNEKVILP